MAEGNAAVAEADTAPAPEATEAETLPESELDNGTETVVSEDSTDSADGDTEDDAEPKTFTLDEHEKVLKAERAKLEESYRQKTENAQRQAEDSARANAYSQNITKAQRDKAGALMHEWQNGIAEVLKQRDNGDDVTVNQQWLANLAMRQADSAFWDQDAAISEFFDARQAATHPDWRKPPELAQALERALHLSPANPQRPAQVLDARLAIMESAVRESITPKLREEIEAEVRAELGAAGKTAAMKANDAARAGQPKPTGIGTTSTTNRVNFKTQQQVDMALFKNEIDLDVARKWLAKGLPYS